LKTGQTDEGGEEQDVLVEDVDTLEMVTGSENDRCEHAGEDDCCGSQEKIANLRKAVLTGAYRRGHQNYDKKRSVKTQNHGMGGFTSQRRDRYQENQRKKYEAIKTAFYSQPLEHEGTLAPVTFSFAIPNRLTFCVRSYDNFCQEFGWSKKLMRLDSVLWFLATRLQEFEAEKMLAGTNGAEDLSVFDR
jgi:hypothetical protein